ncbi:MAG: histidine--tRNA ligase [Deltaproteobacteria bacterium]|nr:histidine--tRNA ligase [Deltaproteobacteria bacterium]
MKITGIKGMSDLLPPASEEWQRIEQLARQIFKAYGFKEIRTPIVEPTALFTRSVGETSAIVEKEMYTFEDRKGTSLTLRPEATASVVRAYVNAGLYATDPIAKLAYFGPMFRYEQPQKGRSRQFYQMGAELLGAEAPLADAELLIMLEQFFKAAGVEDIRLEINSLGCKECRPNYLDAIQKFLKGKTERFCEDCQKRSQRNPLRVLDCKKEGCRKLTEGIPFINDFWCEPCHQHYREVRGLLLAGHVKFKENPRIVRGLDYYCRTAFEVLCDRLGAQNAVAAGGRYDGLVKDLGGPEIPGVGFAIGMERLMMLVSPIPDSRSTNHELIYFALLGNEAQQKALSVVQELRNKGKMIECAYGGSLKSQLRRADKLQASFVVIIGENEIQKGVAIVKEMATGQQQEVLLGRLVEHLA